MEDIKEPVAIWAAITGCLFVTVILFMSLFKIAGWWFDLGDGINSKSDSKICWEKGGQPVYDTGGTNQDYKECNFYTRETK